MAYQNHFKLADDVVSHLDGVIPTVTDPFIVSRYVGFVAVAAVTVYELCIKDIFYEFGSSKHRVLGTFVRNRLDRINGRIKLHDLRNDYIAHFGEKYLKRFNRHLEEAEKRTLTSNRTSLKAAYMQVIECRNQYAHEGKLPPFATYAEVTKDYQTGKAVIHLLARTMTR